MPLVAYPIANDAHEALLVFRQGRARRAVREKEAEQLAGHRVAFVTQSVGPQFDTRDDALAAYAGLVDDDRQGNGFSPKAEDRICKLAVKIKDVLKKRSKSEQPSYTNGQRWPRIETSRESVWQLSISYWKILANVREGSTATLLQDQVRQLRKKAKREDLTPEEILSLAQSPLVASRPQKALDIGLFDFIPPDNPDIIIADE